MFVYKLRFKEYNNEPCSLSEFEETTDRHLDGKAVPKEKHNNN